MKGNFGKLLKQAQKMQQEMAKIQEELAQTRVEGTAGGGVVKVVVSGAQEPLEVKIEPSAVDPQDVEMLEDLVLAALREAMEQAKALAEEKLGAVTGGLGGFPGLPGF
jgi:hypothetical protein